MCDYSLHAVASRPAKVGETLITTTFPRTPTRGFAAESEPGIAVCLLPGTELAFEQNVKYDQGWIWTRTTSFRVAKFGVVEPNVPHRHHDAIEFPDGSNVLVTLLVEGQRATVLQLPVVHQISERTTKAEEHGSTPAAAASAAGRSSEVPAMRFWRQRDDAGGVGGHFLQAGTADGPRKDRRLIAQRHERARPCRRARRRSRPD